MCGRYFIDINISTIQEMIETIEKRYPGVVMSTGEIYPNSTVPIIGRDGPAPAKWGFPKWDNKGIIINAKAETLETRKTFRGLFEKQRCAVPAAGFYEWTKDKTKIKYFFELEDEDILYLAGLTQEFNNELCMVIMTHRANESMKDIHDRMPVILTGDHLDLWLNETDEARDILEMNSPRLIRNQSI